eukprot:2169917-Prymnesium_polylepis.1
MVATAATTRGATRDAERDAAARMAEGRLSRAQPARGAHAVLEAPTSIDRITPGRQQLLEHAGPPASPIELAAGTCTAGETCAEENAPEANAATSAAEVGDG